MSHGIANLQPVCFIGLLMLWVMMYSVFVTCKALVLDRLGEYILEPQQYRHRTYSVPRNQELWCSVV